LSGQKSAFVLVGTISFVLGAVATIVCGLWARVVWDTPSALVLSTREDLQEQVAHFEDPEAGSLRWRRYVRRQLEAALKYLEGRTRVEGLYLIGAALIPTTLEGCDAQLHLSWLEDGLQVRGVELETESGKYSLAKAFDPGYLHDSTKKMLMAVLLRAQWCGVDVDDSVSIPAVTEVRVEDVGEEPLIRLPRRLLSEGFMLRLLGRDGVRSNCVTVYVNPELLGEDPDALP